MKPVLLTPSKAAGLADAYRQFSQNPELNERINGLTRLECYRLFQSVSLFYKQKGEDLALNFLDKVADGKVELSGELFSAEEHDEKLTKEHNELEAKVEPEPPKSRTLFVSAPTRTEKAKEESAAETDEIGTLMKGRARERAEEQLKRLGISEERAKVYSGVVSKRLGEVGEEAARQRGIVQAIVQEVVPELNSEQISGFSDGFLSTGDTGERSAIGTALASSKFPSASGPATRPSTATGEQGSVARESSKELLLRLGHKERGFFGQIKNDFLNQIIPGRREKQEAAALGVAQGALQNFAESHPGQQPVIEGLQEAFGHKEVLRKIDPSGADSAGNISIRSLGRGMPSPRPPTLSTEPEGRGGSFVGNTVQAGMQARDAAKLLGTETGKKLTQATVGRLGALGARLAASAAPAIAGALSGAGAAAMSALGGIGTVVGGALGTTGVGTVVVPAAIILAVLAALIGGALFLGHMQLSSNQRLYVTEGLPSTAIQSEYIDITARVSPNSYKGDLPIEAEFTIIVTAKKGNLEDVKINEIFSVYAKEGSPSPPSVETHFLPTEIADGKSETIIYKVRLEPRFKDSIVTNTITVGANVVDGPKDEKTITSVSTLLGEVPTGCFTFEGNWTDADRALELAAIGTISRNSTFMSKLCKDNKAIRLIRSYDSTTGYGGYVPGDGQIIIYSLGLVDNSNTLYTLAHESGHILDQRNVDLYRDFPRMIKGEGFIPTYGYGQKLSEDFAETIALFVVWKSKSFACCGKVNLPKDFPKHYDFALSRMFGGVNTDD